MVPTSLPSSSAGNAAAEAHLLASAQKQGLRRYSRRSPLHPLLFVRVLALDGLTLSRGMIHAARRGALLATRGECDFNPRVRSRHGSTDWPTPRDARGDSPFRTAFPFLLAICQFLRSRRLQNTRPRPEPNRTLPSFAKASMPSPTQPARSHSVTHAIDPAPLKAPFSPRLVLQ
jgi:hypothetical protein